jgi:Methyltransferase domain
MTLLVRAIIQKVKHCWVNLRWKRSLQKNGLPPDFALGSWSMLPDDFIYIERYVKKLARDELVAVELGSGSSTVYLCKIFSRVSSKVCFISFEGEEDWMVETQTLLKRYSCSAASCNVVLAPYRDYDGFHWFDKNRILEAISGHRVDMLFVDAPPDTLGPCSREPALDFFWPHLRAESTVFLHDSRRQDEDAISGRWSSRFCHVEKLESEKGLTAFMGPKLHCK